MYFMVPSWYLGNDPWDINESYWCDPEMVRLDDGLSIAQQFQAAGDPIQWLLLQYHPHLRYFLQEKEQLKTPYWSFFDEIQHISRQDVRSISYQEFDWPDGTLFLHLASKIIAQCQGETIAEMRFSRYGVLLSVTWYTNGQKTRKYWIDDRGFVSVLETWEQGQLVSRSFLNVRGVWQVKEVFQGASGIYINPQADTHFQQVFYPSWRPLLEEKLFSFVGKEADASDVFILAADERHNRYFLPLLTRYKSMVSFWGNRSPIWATDEIFELMARTNLALVDREDRIQSLKEVIASFGWPAKKIMQSPLLDLRYGLGHSQQEETCHLYLQFAGGSLEWKEQGLQQVLAYLKEEPQVSLTIGVRGAKDEQEQVARVFQEALNGSILQDPSLKERLKLAPLLTDQCMMEILDRTRLAIDLGIYPDAYLQQAGVAVGIPLVQWMETEWVDHQENGWILESLEEIPDALDYFIQDWEQWNHALLSSIQKLSEKTNGRMVDQWLLRLV